jgi:hypothetical protein
LNCKKRKEIMRYSFLILILFLILSGCSCGSGVDNSKDSGVDTGILCGNGYYPSFDYQCKGNVGCREINKGLCSCRCVMCENERCVGMSCGGIGCEGDGGVGDLGIGDFGIDDLGISDLKDAGEDIEGDVIDDVSDIRDAGDGGIDDFEYVCKDPGDPVGVDFWGNLDEPIVKISDRVYMDARISGDYVVWNEFGLSGYYGGNIYYLNLKDRKVRKIPNCDGYEIIYYGIQVEGNKVYWSNAANACDRGSRCGVIFEFDMNNRLAPRIVSLRDEVSSPQVYKNYMIYLLDVSNKEKNGTYFSNLITGEHRRITKDFIIRAYSTSLWENDIIISSRNGIYSLNIDTMEEKIHFESEQTIDTAPYWHRYPYLVFIKYLPKEKYGHYTTDIFILDVRDDSVIQATDDEQFQFSGRFRNNILVYFENYNPEESDVSYGHMIVKDMKTGVKRAVPNSDNHFPRDFDGVRVISTTNIYSDVVDMNIINLEKLGVVKDGHVVPE